MWLGHDKARSHAAVGSALKVTGVLGGALWIAAAIIILLPIASLGWLVGTHWTEQNLSDFGVSCSPSTWLLTTAYVSVTVAGQMLLGVFLASVIYFWSWARPGRLLVAVTLFVLPYAIPSTIAYSMFEFVFGSGGTVSDTWRSVSGAPSSPFSQGWSRFIIMCLVAIWQFFPFALVVTLAAFLAAPRKMIAASRADGAGPYRIWLSILLPIAAPVILAAAFLRLILMLTKIDAPLAFASTSSGDFACLASVRVYTSIGLSAEAMPLGLIMILTFAVAVSLVFYIAINWRVRQ